MKLGGKATVWQTPGCEGTYKTPTGKLKSTTYVYGRGRSRSVSKPE